MDYCLPSVYQTFVRLPPSISTTLLTSTSGIHINPGLVALCSPATMRSITSHLADHPLESMEARASEGGRPRCLHMTRTTRASWLIAHRPLLPRSSAYQPPLVSCVFS